MYLQMFVCLPGILVSMYSWVRLVRPYTEELISRPFVGENRFRLVFQDPMGPKNAIGCVLVSAHLLLFWLPEVGSACGPCISHQSNFAFLLYPFWLFWNKSIWKHPLSTTNFCLFVFCLYNMVTQTSLVIQKKCKIALMRTHMGRFRTNPLENRLCLALSTANFWKSKQK